MSKVVPPLGTSAAFSAEVASHQWRISLASLVAPLAQAFEKINMFKHLPSPHPTFW